MIATYFIYGYAYVRMFVRKWTDAAAAIYVPAQLVKFAIYL